MDHINDHLEGAFVSLLGQTNSSSNYKTQSAPPRFVNYMDSVSVASASDMLNGTVAFCVVFLVFVWVRGCDGEGPKQETVSKNISKHFKRNL